jgi:hypothetical protein
MDYEKILPTLQIVISIAAAAVYAYHGDWRKVAYWLAGAVIVASVTY